MDKTTQKVYEAAQNARALLSRGGISYEEALRIVKNYTDYANIKAKHIAKRFGIKPKLIDPRGFLR